MRQLFLHVGTHKTGTTSLQAYLADNRARLRQQGVAIATERHRKFGEIANCFALAHSVLRPSLMTLSRMTGDAKKPRFWRDVKAHAQMKSFLADRDAKTFVLSAEAFCFARSAAELAKVKNLLGSWNGETIPVVCFREERGWRDSWFDQIHKYEAQFHHVFGEGFADIREDWYFDRDDIARFWGEVGPLRTVDFDAAVASHGTVLPALLEAMGLPNYGNVESYFLNTRRSDDVAAPQPEPDQLAL